MSRPTLADIAIAIMICDAIDMIPRFGATWGYVDIDGNDRAYSLAFRTRSKSPSWPGASLKLRRMQHRRLAALAKAINARSSK